MQVQEMTRPLHARLLGIGALLVPFIALPRDLYLLDIADEAEGAAL